MNPHISLRLPVLPGVPHVRGDEPWMRGMIWDCPHETSATGFRLPKSVTALPLNSASTCEADYERFACRFP